MSRSLIPALLGWPSLLEHPHRLIDQHLRLLDDDFYSPSLYVVTPRRQTTPDLRSEMLSDIVCSRDKFQVMTDVSHFSPEDITVKTVDNSVVIHGKHEEKMDQHGFVSREFTRRYVLPDGVDPKTVTSSLSSDGVLTVEAPKKREALPANERVVPITVQKCPSVTPKKEEDAAEKK